MKVFTQSGFTMKSIIASVAISAGLILSSVAQAEPESPAKALPSAPEVSAVELAYKKELAFLQAQKQNLQGRLTRLLQDTNDKFTWRK